jgi:hypothetical protein
MKKTAYYLVTIIIVLGVLDILSAITVRYFTGRGLLYVEQGDTGDYDDYLRQRDAVLGWPAQPYDPAERDSSGSRIIPAYPDPDQYPACVSLYGDSFTYGAEVDHEHAWSNILSELLQCRVANYGVGGYGTDQAYLRYLKNGRDRSDIVILGHLSADIVRNVNQFRNLLSSGTNYGLKPRFIQDPEGHLELIPLPEFTKDEYRAMVKEPEKYLPHEYFVRFDFPYLWSLFRSFDQFRMRLQLRRRPLHFDFYRDDHPSGALQVTGAIIERFAELAASRGQRPIILMIPTCEDLAYYHENGVWATGPLMELLKGGGWDVLEAGPGLMENLQGRDPCRLCYFDHFNEDGNRILAEMVSAHIKSMKW